MTEPLSERKARVRATFDQVAPEYDAGPGCFAHFGRRLVEAAAIAPGQRVLDVASGRGAVLLPAAEAVGPAGEVTGIDLSPEMVTRANEAARARGLPATVRVMDAEQLAFPDGYYDRVLCGFGIMFFPNPLTALREFRRVLAAGGRVGLSTWHETQAYDLEQVLKGMTLPSADLPLKQPEEVERLLLDAGFTEVRVQLDPATFPFADLDDYWQCARGTGLRPALDHLTAEQTAWVRERLAERIATDCGVSAVARAVLAVAVA